MSDAPGPDQAGPQTKPPEPPRPRPPAATEPGGRRALLLGIVGLLATPLGLIGAILPIAAIVSGVRARKRGRRVLAPAPGAVAGIVLGAIGLVICTSAVVFEVAAGKDFQDYVRCRESALTIDDQQTCRHTYVPRIERRLHLRPGALQNNHWF